MRRLPSNAAMLAFLLVATAPSTAAAERVLINAVVGSVDGKPITMLDLDQFAKGAALMLPPSDRGNRHVLLETLVQQRMFEAEFEALDLTASDEEVEAYIDHLVAENNSSREDVKRVLARLGLTWDQYFERMRHEVQRLALINREIRTRVNVTPEEVERYWEESDVYLRPQRVEIADIFIPIPADATPEMLASGEAYAKEAQRAAKKNFAKAAREYSAGPTAEDGGVLGAFRRGTMAPAFERVLAELEPGEVSKPFEAEGAWHIIKLVREVPRERVPLDDVRSDIEEQLYDQALDTRFRRWIDEDLRKRHHSTMQLDELDQLVDAQPS